MLDIFWRSVVFFFFFSSGRRDTSYSLVTGGLTCPLPICPGLDLALADLGIGVARQVDQHQPAAEVEEIDLPGRARGGRNAGQGPAASQRVDQDRKRVE